MTDTEKQSKLENLLRWCYETRVVYTPGEGWKIPPKRVRYKTSRDSAPYVVSRIEYLSIAEAVQMLDDLREYLTPEALLERKQRQRKATLSNGGFFENEEDFVADYFPQLGIEIAPGGAIVGEKAQMVEEMMLMAAHNYNRKITKEMTEMGIRKLDNKAIPWALHLYCSKYEDERKNNLLDQIAYTNADPKMVELRKFVRAIRSPSTSKDTFELDVAVLHHMLWQVKRRMFGLTPDPILATFIHGDQNTGKSTALRMLFAPVKEYLFEADINNAIDIRWNFLAERYFVLNVEELLGMAKTDIEKLKSFVTKQIQVTRILGGHRTAITKQNLSIVGSTNRSIDSLIGDETGMRRWYQIQGPIKGERMDFDAINSTDFLTIWHSVNEEKEFSPLFSNNALVKQLLSLQESWRRHSETESFLRSTKHWPLVEGGAVVEYSLDTIMAKLGAWCEANSIKCPDRRRVKHQLSDLRVACTGQIPNEKWILSAPAGTRAGTTVTPSSDHDEFAALSLPLDMGQFN